MNIPEFLSQDDHGDIRLRGHRVHLEHIVRHYNEGYSPEMLLGQFPTLTLALLHKVIAFYLENQTEVDVYVATCRAEIEAQAKEPRRGPDVTELRRRLHALSRAETK